MIDATSLTADAKRFVQALRSSEQLPHTQHLIVPAMLGGELAQFLEDNFIPTYICALGCRRLYTKVVAEKLLYAEYAQQRDACACGGTIKPLDPLLI